MSERQTKTEGSRQGERLGDWDTAREALSVYALQTRFRSTLKSHSEQTVKGLGAGHATHSSNEKKNVSTSFIRFFSGAWRQHFSLACGDGGGSSSEYVSVPLPAWLCVCLCM